MWRIASKEDGALAKREPSKSPAPGVPAGWRMVVHSETRNWNQPKMFFVHDGSVEFMQKSSDPELDRKRRQRETGSTQWAPPTGTRDPVPRYELSEEHKKLLYELPSDSMKEMPFSHEELGEQVERVEAAEMSFAIQVRKLGPGLLLAKRFFDFKRQMFLQWRRNAKALRVQRENIYLARVIMVQARVRGWLMRGRVDRERERDRRERRMSIGAIRKEIQEFKRTHLTREQRQWFSDYIAMNERTGYASAIGYRRAFREKRKKKEEQAARNAARQKK
eukprot:g3046.t1